MSPPSRKSSKRAKVGLALAGGGPEGAVYEIGALRAIDEVVEGLDMNNLDVYVGVSAGAFITANLANDLTTAQMCRAIVKHEPGEHPFDFETFFSLDLKELALRSALVPGLLASGVWDYLRNPRDVSLLESLMRLGRAMPVAFFDNDGLRDFLHRIYTIKGRTDDFRELGKKLVIVAADLDSGEPVLFGTEGLEHIPISVAVQASTALPGLYSPVDIDGRHYVDGVLLKTLHASVALDEGAELLLCLNPLVPVDTSGTVEAGIMRRGKLIDRGLPTVLSQAMRTMIRSRMGAAMARYERAFKSSDVILFEPRRDDYRMFFTNVFRFSSRAAVCEHAYRSTRQQLRDRQEELVPALARHGLELRTDLLADDSMDLWSGVGLGPDHEPQVRVLKDLDDLLNRLDRELDEIKV